METTSALPWMNEFTASEMRWASAAKAVAPDSSMGVGARVVDSMSMLGA
ncbi:unannotated protein [freshwater metagenome]|uniref:Unannotated protein n=1 Tax=freshwater metagenome TaxID=449393 RepID=A0A6J7R9X3_9ZZZZ